VRERVILSISYLNTKRNYGTKKRILVENQAVRWEASSRNTKNIKYSFKIFYKYIKLDWIIYTSMYYLNCNFFYLVYIKNITVIMWQKKYCNYRNNITRMTNKIGYIAFWHISIENWIRPKTQYMAPKTRTNICVRLLGIYAFGHELWIYLSIWIIDLQNPYPIGCKWIEYYPIYLWSKFKNIYSICICIWKVYSY
jgi:hypothetical protein